MSMSPPPEDRPDTARPPGIEQLDPAVSAALLDTVLTCSRSGLILLDSGFRCVFVNEMAADIYGLRMAEDLGRRLPDMLPDISAAVMPILSTVLETGEAVVGLDVSGQERLGPGALRQWSVSVIRLARPDGIGDHLVAVVVTEEFRSHHQLRQLIDNLFTFVGLLSPDGTMLEANQVALDAGGLALDDVLGRPFWEASWWSHDPAVQQQLRRAVTRAAAGEPSRYDVLIRLAGNLLVPIDFQLAPIMEDGVVTALVPSGLEISARVRESSRLAALARFSAALNAAATTGEVVAAVLDGAELMEEASFLNIALIDNEARCVRIAMKDVDPELIDKWAVVPLDGMDTPLHHAINSGRIVTVSDREDLRRRFPHLVDETIAVGLEGTVSLPLIDDNGDPLGSIGLGWPGPIQVTPEAESRFRLVVDLCSQALQRTRRSEVFADLVGILQRELLTVDDLPDGLDLAVEYRPAVDELGFGGDWYDIVDLGGRVAVVVGDVAGHGVSAAAHMAQIKGVLRALTTVGSLSELMAAASQALAPREIDFLATACVVTVDRSSGLLEWVSAGHLPPAVLHPNGSAHFLSGAPMPPIGVVRTPAAPSTHVLEPGAVVVLYTDGLVERRDRSIDVGLAELLDTLRTLPSGSDAATIRDTLLAELIPGTGQEDDVAIVVVRFPLNKLVGDVVSGPAVTLLTQGRTPE